MNQRNRKLIFDTNHISVANVNSCMMDIFLISFREEWLILKIKYFLPTSLSTSTQSPHAVEVEIESRFSGSLQVGDTFLGSARAGCLEMVRFGSFKS